MRPSILLSSFALIFGLTNNASAQVVWMQQSWAPTPIFVCQSFALQQTMPGTAAPANSLPTHESRYGNARIIPAPAQFVVAVPQQVRLERYYFIPSPMEPIVPPSVDPKAVPKEEVASPFGGVIIREYFVMDQPAASKIPVERAPESTPSATPQNSSQEKPAESKSGKLDKPKWSDEFDKSEKAPESNSNTPAPGETKDATPAPASDPKDATPPAEEKKETAPTDPIAPATPGTSV